MHARNAAVAGHVERQAPGFSPEALAARLSRYVATPSISRQEGALAELIAAELKAAGLAVQQSGHNAWCEFGDALRPRLLLNSHLDTVPPGAAWAQDPWQPRIVDGRVIGLGANDAKGCVTALIEAALATKQRLERGERLGGTVVLALTAEEEISGQGLAAIVSQLGPIDAAIVGEPTGLTPMIAQRGLMILRGIARGRTSHPANTSTGAAKNAIVVATEDIRRLADFDWGAVHPVLGPCHAHVTKIAGGVALNVIPDTCEFWIDVRTTPAEPHAALFARLQAFLKSELHVHSDRLAPIETAVSERIVQAVLRALPGSTTAGSPAMSDMVFLPGVPAVKIGPGESLRSHTPDEYITLAELADGAAAYERIISEYFKAQ